MIYIESRGDYLGKEELALSQYLPESTLSTTVVPLKGDIMIGRIDFIRNALKLINSEPVEVPPYPTQISPFLGRKIEVRTVADIIMNGSDEDMFIKPVQEKLFTGQVLDGADGWRLSYLPLDTRVYKSEVLTFSSEVRAYVADGEILHIANYKGENKPPTELVHSVLSVLEELTTAYSIDLGLTVDGWVVVECNSGYALGMYDMSTSLYWQFVQAYWRDFWKDK